MVLALNMVQKGGMVFIKMFTYVTEESHYLIDTLSQYFEQIYLTKPFTSRLTTDESYILCINRNDKDCSSVPLSRPHIESYKSPNLSLITTFESTRADYKMQMVSLLFRILEKMPNITFKALLQNYQYKIYYNQISRLNFLFYNLNHQQPSAVDSKQYIPDI